MPPILRHCSRPALSIHAAHWPRLQRKPLVAMDLILILEFVPAIIRNIAQMEMANADWPLTCTCWKEPVPSPFQIVAALEYYTVKLVLNIWGFLCNFGQWVVWINSGMVSEHQCSVWVTETRHFLGRFILENLIGQPIHFGPWLLSKMTAQFQSTNALISYRNFCW